MNRNRSRRWTTWAGAAVLVAAMLACNLSKAATPTLTPGITQANPPVSASTDTPTPTNAAPTGTPTLMDTATSTPIVHVSMPGEPSGGLLSQISDPNSSGLASAHRANGGDSFTYNLYERPFTSTSMDYQPDLDITKTSLSRDPTWVYVTISLAGQNPSGGLTGDYGVELDLDLDGRGDMLLMAAKPGAAWSTDGVRDWTDSNNDVGGAHPILSDPPASTDGYDTLVLTRAPASIPMRPGRVSQPPTRTVSSLPSKAA